MASDRRHSAGRILLAGLAAAGFCGSLCLALLAAIGGMAGSAAAGATCGGSQVVGATEYGGPGDPSSGTIGASGVNLVAQPDSFAELGGTSFATATSLGGPPYGTALQISFGARSVVAYKEDIGRGGGPVNGRPRVIDLWWQLARSLGIPYEDGRWSGTVRVAPPSGACASAAGPPLSSGLRARLLPDGDAAAPVSAPAAVAEMIAAGNQIIGYPYSWGGGHSPASM